MNKIKKALATAVPAVLCASAFAEGEPAAIDTSAASDALETMVTAVSGYITTVTPYLITILSAAVVITLVWVGWKLFRRGTSKVG